MYSLRDFLGFFLGAAITAAVVVLLLPPAPCPCGQDLASVNGSQANLSMSKLNTAAAAAASKEDNELAELLRSAAMEDNTIIMTFTNEALMLPGSLLELFLESFRVGVGTQPLLKHLVIVTMDGKAFERCGRMHPLCYLLVEGRSGSDDGLAAEMWFMSPNYLDMMWARNRFQARVLGLGFSFVFTDVDIVWFRNPLLRIPAGADVAMACDQFYGHTHNPYDLEKSANGGFVYARASPRTAAFYRGWYEARARYPGEHEQGVFQLEKRELAARHGVTLQLVDTAYLGSHCEPKKDFYKLCMYHANCLFGLQNKIGNLTAMLDEWKLFKAQHELTY